MFIITTLIIVYLSYLLLIPLFFVPSEPSKFATNYRIVKTTYKNDDIDYTIQQRFSLTPFWLYCHKQVGMDTYQKVTFDTEKEAKTYLKRYTDSHNDDKKIIKQEVI